MRVTFVACTVLAAFVLLPISRASAEPLPLWPDGAPHANGEEAADIPTLEVFLPDNADGVTAAVVICPGGGYGALADQHEGIDIARHFNELGVAAFILRYRLAPHYREPVPLLDAQRAIRHVRHHARQYNVDPDRLGIMGFSAGGHLAASTGTLIGEAQPDADDPIDQHSARPDFMILCYPVIDMTDDVMHTGSRNNLLGSDPTPEQAERYTLQNQVSERTPPTFLFHTDEDEPVPAENSVRFYLAMREAGVPAEMHIYRPGPHGVGLAPEHPVLSTWPELLTHWLRGLGVVEGR